MTSENHTSRILLDRALGLHRSGFSVIPLKKNGKSPAIPWKKYQSEQPTEAEIAKWFKPPCELNIAIVTGAISGIVAIDADSPEAQEWCLKNLPPTPMRCKTVKGEHHYYRYPDVKVPNGVKLKGLPLDVRGDGGYIVAPGSTHPTGARYEELGDWSTLEHVPVFDPAWIAEDAPEDPILRFIRNAPDSVQGADGSAELMRTVAKLMRGFELTQQQAWPYLTEWNHLHGKPLWSEDELRHAMDSIEKSPAPRSNGSQGGKGLQGLLMKDSKGKLLSFQANVEILLAHHPDLAGTVSWCEFSYQVRILHSMPWGGAAGDAWSDRDDVELRSLIENQFRWSPKESHIQGALIAIAHRNPSHPVREYLSSLKWDGVPRLETWAAVYLGVKDDSYSKIVGRKCLVQCVARIFKPGCKADHIVILEGEQGIRKSSAIRALVPRSEWFEDGRLDLQSKDGLMAMRGKWIFELQELDTLSKADASRVKAFVTDQEDSYRVPYGRQTQTFPRQCSFIGTTNEHSYLPDTSGNRRFLPLACKQIDVDAIVRDRDQLWAEAVNAFNQGEVWHLTASESELVREPQDARRIEDPWETAIAKYLERKPDVTLAEVLGEGLDLPHQSCKSADAYRASKILTGIFGWRKTKVMRRAARVNGYVPNPAQPA